MNTTNEITREMIAGVIDHTYLKTEKEGVSFEDQKLKVRELIEQAHQYRVYAVCVRENLVSFASSVIKSLGSSVVIASVIGFPEGDNYSTQDKVSLLEQARKDGAEEFDMVIKYRALRERDLNGVYEDIFNLSQAAKSDVLKVIFENAYLNQEEKKLSYEIAKLAFIDSARNSTNLGPRFFKSSTGFATPEPGVAVGATLEDIRLMAEVTKGTGFGIKPAGGVNNLKEAISYFEAVGTPWKVPGKVIDPLRFRIGTSSLLGNLFELKTTGSY